MSPTDLLVPPGCDLLITEMAMTEDLLVVVATPTAMSSCCPCCGSASDRVHSRYRRTVGDLPFGGRQLALRLMVRKFFCSNPGCQRQVFCERLSNFVEAYARSTKRLQSLQQSLGATAGGEAGSRLARDMAMPVSGDTLIRRVKASTREPETPVRCLGIDDFAFRKGQHYGTILIDLERGRVIDLLKSREADDVDAWLKAHPGVEVITRDRASAYANAASSGAPQAKQVADRWHLLKNVREAVERLLDRRHKAVKVCLKEHPPPTHELDSPGFSGDPEPLEPQTILLTAREEFLEGKRQQRLDVFNRVHEIHAAGTSNRQIATLLDLDRDTVARYLKAESFPERKSSPSLPSEKYREYLDRRLNEGCRNAAALHRELIADGLDVSYYAVRRYVRRRLTALGAESASGKPEARRPSAKQLSFMIIRKPEERDDEEQSRIDALTSIDDAMSQALELVVQFAAMIRGVLALSLADWLSNADASDCAEIQAFAKTLRQDKEAVQAAMAEPWSNGPVEGQVNRLKLIKRQMYGRAGFELLRARVCAAA
jgi:transposase